MTNLDLRSGAAKVSRPQGWPHKRAKTWEKLGNWQILLEEAGVQEYSSGDKLAKYSQRSTLTSTSYKRSCSSITESRKRATFERWGLEGSMLRKQRLPLQPQTRPSLGKPAAIRPGATTRACGKTIYAGKVTFRDMIWLSVVVIRPYMFWRRWYIWTHWFQIVWPCCLFCTSARSNSSYKYTLYLGVASLTACLFNSIYAIEQACFQL